MSEPIHATMTDAPVCPHCGHTVIDEWELVDSGETCCELCSLSFLFVRHKFVAYTTVRKDP